MKAKKYQVEIKMNSTCPQRENVTNLIASSSASFKSVIGTEAIRGFFPVYVDSEKKENMYGMVYKVVDRRKNIELTSDEIKDIIIQGVDVILTSVNKNIINAELILDDVKNANVASGAISDTLQKLIDEKIADGIVTKEEMDARMKVMRDNKVDEALKIRVVKGYRRYNKSAHKPRCIYVDPYIEKVKGNNEGIVAEGLRNAVSRMASICEGEKSVGKNVYMETIAWLLGMPLYMIGFSRNMSPSAIYGEKSTDNSASEKLKTMHDQAIAKVMLDINAPELKNRVAAINAAADFELQKARAASVSIVIDQSELYDWLIDGGCMVLNEMNMAESNFFSSFINPLTDGTGFLFIPGRGEVKMHHDCVLFGTQNADYEGVQQQNEATMSRFNTLYFEQPESVIGQFKAATQSALDKDGCTYKLDNKYFIQAQKFYSQCQKSVRGGIISNAVLNIRGFVRALTVVAESEARCTLSRWLKICVIDTCPTDEREALSAILNTIVTL